MPQLVEEVEALVCCKAIWFALEIGSREIIFKGDTIAMIQVLEKEKKNRVCLFKFIWKKIRQGAVAALGIFFKGGH